MGSLDHAGVESVKSPLMEHTLPWGQAGTRAALVVGNHCHDILTLRGGGQAHVLGGSVSYIANVLDALGLESQVVSKVGPDFAYGEQVASHPPIVCPGQLTTQFFADLNLADSSSDDDDAAEDRALRAGNICEPVFARDIPSGCTFSVALAVGIAGEILPETIERMAAASPCIIVDLQALVRKIEVGTGAVSLARLEDTPFYPLLSRISYLKAAEVEAACLDLEEVRKKTCVVITRGPKGCTVYDGEREYPIEAFSAQEIDPTGAGDSFLAGFSAGLCLGMSPAEAARVGNYFGALAVGQVGVPTFSPSQASCAGVFLPTIPGTALVACQTSK